MKERDEYEGILKNKESLHDSVPVERMKNGSYY